MSADRLALEQALELAKRQVVLLEAILGLQPSEEKSICVSSAQASLRDELRNIWRDIAPNELVPELDRADIWESQGYRRDVILAVVREKLKVRSDVRRLSYFDQAIAEAHENMAPVARLKTELPRDFWPSEKAIDWLRAEAIQIGLTLTKVIVREETDKMIDYHNGKGTMFADHDAAWRSWMREYLKRLKESRSRAANQAYRV